MAAPEDAECGKAGLQGYLPPGLWTVALRRRSRLSPKLRTLATAGVSGGTFGKVQGGLLLSHPHMSAMTLTESGLHLGVEDSIQVPHMEEYNCVSFLPAKS